MELILKSVKKELIFLEAKKPESV